MPQHVVEALVSRRVGLVRAAARDRRVPGSEPRAGYRSVTPRVVVDDVAAQVHFLREVFAAAGDVEPGRPAEIHIGDSVIMISSTAEREPFPAFLNVYVDDADEAFQRAVDAGAQVLEEPLDTPYRDRRAMVRDPFGNILQIAHPSRSADLATAPAPYRCRLKGPSTTPRLHPSERTDRRVGSPLSRAISLDRDEPAR